LKTGLTLGIFNGTSTEENMYSRISLRTMDRQGFGRKLLWDFRE